jgi:hypothetical protein
MQRDLDIGILLKNIEKRQIAVLVGGFEHIVKVPDRLMIVQNKAKLNLRMAH